MKQTRHNWNRNHF